jgi:hypothetical protein
MDIEQRLEVIKNRMGEHFDSQFKYKHTIESFCEQWEEYYKRNDRWNFLKEQYSKEYIPKGSESFYLYDFFFDKNHYEICYLGFKNKERYCSINGIIIKLNSDFENEVSKHFPFYNSGFILYSSMLFCLKSAGVKFAVKIFKKHP